MKPYLAKTAVTILDNKWSIVFCNAAQYKRRGPDGSRAYAAIKRKIIYFNCDQFFPNDQVVLHELTHAYAEELMAHDLSLSETDTEEFWCTLMEQRGHAIIKKAAGLTKQFRAIVKKQIKKNDTDKEEDDEDE